MEFIWHAQLARRRAATRCAIRLTGLAIVAKAVCHISTLPSLTFAFWMQRDSMQATEAHTTWAKAHPHIAASGMYMGEPLDDTIVKDRFRSLVDIAGDEDLALEFVKKEPVILNWQSSSLQRSWDALKRLEAAEPKSSSVSALEIVTKNPRVLTVPDFEYERSKPSIQTLDMVASMEDTLRPFGPMAYTGAVNLMIVSLLTVCGISYTALGPTVKSALSGVKLPEELRLIPDGAPAAVVGAGVAAQVVPGIIGTIAAKANTDDDDTTSSLPQTV